MTNLPRFFRSILPTFGGTAAAVFAAFVLLAVPVAGNAQETTTSIRGTLSDSAGAPVSGANVVVRDARTGRTRTTTSSGSGRFQLSGLSVGGPYTVQISADNFASQSVTDVYLSLGETYSFDLALSPSQIEEIIVTAAAIDTAATALGPSSSFSLEELQTAPSIGRDIKEVIRFDPRVYIDRGFRDGLQCGGANPRYNSFTVDGTRMNDNFGLNDSGWPTERMPFPYDAIQQVAVELAPFDVQYGGFTACNINAVTKSGGNEFHGSAFYDYTDDSLRGDKLEGDTIETQPFEEKRYGFNVSGPILKDRLFFAVAYEKLEGANLFQTGPEGSGAGDPVAGVNVAQINEIRDISSQIYGYDPGGFQTSHPNEDEKILVKLDWEISDKHRAALTYDWNDGFNISRSDQSSTRLEFDRHRYERGAELTVYTGQLFSDWNDRFSTELRVSSGDLDNRQISLGGLEFGEVQIRTTNPDNGSRATVYLGADDSRQSNKLTYEVLNLKLAGSYAVGDHVISGGIERDEFDVFNLFIQETEGEILFDSIDDFRNGVPNQFIYENAAPSNIPADGAAEFGYQINTAYVQDEFTVMDGALDLVVGLRYDWYTSDDLPKNNPNFVGRYGYSNSQNFDGESLLQPRFGFTWDARDDLSIHGGVGLYSGGNPNVWLGNNYQNNGITLVDVRKFNWDIAGDTLFNVETCANADCSQTVTDGSQAWRGIPLELFNAVGDPANTPDSGVNSLDPNFKIPAQWKLALGAKWNFDAGFMGTDYVLQADYLYTKYKQVAFVRDIAQAQIGSTPDGRPVYRNVDYLDPACSDPATVTTCDARSFFGTQQDLQLTNGTGDLGGSRVFSVALSKYYDWGLDWHVAYAHTESRDVSPMTSSTAGSNYGNIAVSDPNNPTAATSNYEIPERFTFRIGYRKAFFGDNETRINIYGSRNKGRPYSYTFDGRVFGDRSFDRQLIYVPTGPNDPNVTFGPDFDQTAFFNFLDESGLAAYGGGIAPRNELYSSWWTRVDLRVEQELPGFAADHNFAAFFVIANIGNMLNDDWGAFYEQAFPRTVNIIGASLDANNNYVYEDFFTPPGQSRNATASLWELRFGVKYSF